MATIPKMKTRSRYEDDPLPTVLKKIHYNAPREDSGEIGIADSMSLLKSTGLLNDDGTDNPQRTVRWLARLGGANLSVARLAEGHVNALYLLRIHGPADVARSATNLVAAGALLGVWGADDSVPLHVDDNAGTLRGGKKFASGLGVVTHAVVSVGSGRDVRLALVDVTNPRRHDTTRWQMPGMKATLSGAYDFDGLALNSVTWIGQSGDYLIEPHFLGGVWRIAALQIGAALGLLDAVAARLRDNHRIGAEAQKARLSRVLIRAMSGLAMVERAAEAVGQRDPEDAVALSITARLLTEDIALDTIRCAEQALGLGHFEDGSDTARMARDLSVYLRQAAGDAFLMRLADRAFVHCTSVWELVE